MRAPAKIDDPLLMAFVKEGVISPTVAKTLTNRRSRNRLLKLLNSKDIPAIRKRLVLRNLKGGRKVDIGRQMSLGVMEMKAYRMSKRILAGEIVELDLVKSFVSVEKQGDVLWITFGPKDAAYRCRISMEPEKSPWPTKFDVNTIQRLLFALLGRQTVIRLRGVKTILYEDGREPEKVKKYGFLGIALRRGVPPFVGVLLETL